MKPSPRRALAVLLPTLGLAVTLAALDTRAAADDPLAREVQRDLAFCADTAGAGDLARSIKTSGLPVLRQVQVDLEAGRRWAALHRLAAVRLNLGGLRYVEALGAAQRDQAGFEAEWKRVGARLASDSARAAALGAVEPAALRAQIEATRPQAHIFHEASLEYGHNTEPLYGLFYLGTALAAEDLASYFRTLAAPAGRRAPPLRSLRGEIDALQRELLAAYHPPASVNRHSEFIGASSALKEARALDTRGSWHGAMLRYLTAAARCAPLIDTTAAPDAAALASQLDAFAKRLDAGGVDHSIARVFLEMARGELAAATGTSPAIAVSVVRQSLPRYFSALEPRATPLAAKPEVDITLVRWPFT